MPKSPEKYEPTPEEIKRAEGDKIEFEPAKNEVLRYATELINRILNLEKERAKKNESLSGLVIDGEGIDKMGDASPDWQVGEGDEDDEGNKSIYFTNQVGSLYGRESIRRQIVAEVDKTMQVIGASFNYAGGGGEFSYDKASFDFRDTDNSNWEKAEFLSNVLQNILKGIKEVKIERIEKVGKERKEK